MKVTVRLLLSLTLSCHWILLFGQESDVVLASDHDNIYKIVKGTWGYEVTPQSEIEGSPFVLEFVEGEIYRRGNSKFIRVPVSFDASKNGFIIQFRGQLLEMDSNEVDSIFVDGKKWKSLNGIYFQVLNTENVVLLKKYKAILQSPTYVPALNSGSRNSSWKITFGYFIYLDEKLIEVKLSRRSLKKVITITKESENEIAKRGLSYSSELDLIEILKILK